MNLQQIPSSNKEIRMMFKASEIYSSVDIDEENCCKINNCSDVCVDGKWVNVKNIVPDMNIELEDSIEKVINIKRDDEFTYLYF